MERANRGAYAHRDANYPHRMKTTDSIGREKGSCHLSKIEYCDDPRKLCPRKMQVRIHVEHGRVVDCLLI